ncbi:MAG TPA: hypothetical protein VMA37_15520 [Acetobacteraceae bacterium]|nr:hypothetical protein [Acetobacteraceae bacterium]
MALGALCAGGMEEAEAKARIEAYEPMLAERFHPHVFCASSLEAVAAASSFWPSYGEVAERLTEWLRQNPGWPGGPSAIADGTRQDCSEMDHSWLEYWRKCRTRGFPLEPGESVPKSVWEDMPKRPTASDCKRAPRVWEFIKSGGA